MQSNPPVRPRAGPHTSGELMFDHVKFGVSDCAASKAFFLKALEPLGVAVASKGPAHCTVSSLVQRVRLHCACTKPRRSRRIFTWRSRPRIASKSKLSIARLWRRVAKTMVRLVCARTTTRTTMQLSSLVLTGTTSKWFATNPRPNHCSSHRDGYAPRPVAPHQSTLMVFSSPASASKYQSPMSDQLLPRCRLCCQSSRA